MRLGMALPQSNVAASRSAILHIAREAEAIGLDSLWVLDRLLRPRTPVSAIAGQPGEVMSDFYTSILDPLELLSFVAAATERIHLGTSVINALYHQPVILARRFATLDHLSGGRVIAGLSQGWMPEEFQVGGTSPGNRPARFTEFVDTMRAVWAPDPVTFHGRWYTIPASDIGPKPTQTGGIPIVVGCFHPAATARAGRIADGINPLATTLDQLHTDIRTMRDAASAADREPDALQVILRVNATPAERMAPNGERGFFAGSIEQWMEDLHAVQELGVGHVFFALDDADDGGLRTMTTLREQFPR